MCYWYSFKNKLKVITNYMYSLLKILFFNILKIIGVIIIIFIVFSASVFIFNKCDIQTPSDMESQEIFIYGISLSNWGTWITLIGLIFTAIWSMHQYIKSRNLSQQEKASLIAQDFANNLIERMSLISGVLMQNQEVQKMIKIIDENTISQFTKIEAKDIFNNANCFENFSKILKSKKTQQRYNKILSENYNNKEKEKFDSNFNVLVSNTLNQLEAICINISSEAAGSQFIYESLHQMFLSTIEILYLKISDSNRNNVDKYYTNVISVYNMWNLQKNKDIKKLTKTSKKIQKLENKVDKEIQKLLNKQTKTV